MNICFFSFVSIALLGFVSLNLFGFANKGAAATVSPRKVRECQTSAGRNKFQTEKAFSAVISIPSLSLRPRNHKH